MAEIIPEGDPRRAPKAHPLSDFVVCEKCGLYSLKSDPDHHFQGCSNDPNYEKPKKTKTTKPVKKSK